MEDNEECNPLETLHALVGKEDFSDEQLILLADEHSKTIRNGHSVEPLVDLLPEFSSIGKKVWVKRCKTKQVICNNPPLEVKYGQKIVRLSQKWKSASEDKRVRTPKRIIKYTPKVGGKFYLEMGQRPELLEIALSEMYANLVLHMPLLGDGNNNGPIYVNADISKASDVVKKQTKIFSSSLRFPKHIIEDMLMKRKVGAEDLAPMLGGTIHELRKQVKLVERKFAVEIPMRSEHLDFIPV